MTSQEKYHSLNATIIRPTEMALRIELDDGEEIWVPKSVCGKVSASTIDSYEAGDEVVLYLAEWFAKEKGVI